MIRGCRAVFDSRKSFHVPFHEHTYDFIFYLSAIVDRLALNIQLSGQCTNIHRFHNKKTSRSQRICTSCVMTWPESSRVIYQVWPTVYTTWYFSLHQKSSKEKKKEVPFICSCFSQPLHQSSFYYRPLLYQWINQQNISASFGHHTINLSLVKLSYGP